MYILGEEVRISERFRWDIAQKRLGNTDLNGMI